MCGIAGLINDQNISKDYLSKITDNLLNRGPDHQDIWLDQKRNFCFIHTRLSIIDLSNTGNQPMRSQSGNILITFNGEIYNHLTIRKKINIKKSKFNWKGSSDTETILEAIDLWGVEKTLKMLDGMFAFCIFDYSKNTFYLARDKFGEKPLYYGWNNNVFIFGSDLNILKDHKSFDRELDHHAISYFLKLSYIPAPLTIFKNMKKLSPGSFLKISYSNMETGLSSYWSVDQNTNKESLPNNFSEIDYIDKCNKILTKSVTSRTLADVPIGAFLSSGVDSALIVSIIKTHTDKKLSTFTLGYEGEFQDETQYAKLIAKNLNTEHYELKVNYDDIFETINEIPKTYSEPFADSSQIPTMLISKFAKKKVSVVLTGDGGDEIFGGYNRHVWLNRLNKISNANRKILSIFLNLTQKSYLSNLLNTDLRLKIDKITNILNCKDIQQMYFSSIFHDYEKELFKDEEFNSNEFFKFSNLKSSNINDVEKMMLIDTKYYLPDDILSKVDRASMNYSLESRAPFLNQELFDFGFNLPSKYKVKNKINKYLLRKVLEIYLPKNLIVNKKKGFSIPLGHWMKTRLKSWCFNSIFEIDSFSQKNFNKSVLEKIWKEHQQGKKDRSKIIWNIITLNNWIKEWKI
jgi:asparagine synthase (glutamine-hydrolysing)